MVMKALFALVVVARCATGQEFNDALAEGIMNELSLELRSPWSTLDYDAALIESGLALKDNYSTIDFDLVRGLHWGDKCVRFLTPEAAGHSHPSFVLRVCQPDTSLQPALLLPSSSA